MLWNISSEYKKNNIFIRIFFILFSTFPIGWAFINAIRYWATRDFRWKIIILSGVVLLVGIAVYISQREIKTKKEEIIGVVFATLLAFILRYMMAELLDTYPVSDMNRAFDAAKSLAAGKGLPELSQGYYSMYPHWGAWVIVLSAVMRVFGQSLEVARNFCVMLSALNVPIYYYSVKLICKNVKIAKIAAFLIMISPGAICYSGVLINDHMSEPFVGLLFAFLALVYRKREENEIKKAIFYLVLAAICLGMFQYFKLVGLVILLATMIGEFVTNIVPGFLVLVKEHNWKRFLMNCITSLGMLLILFGGYKGIISTVNVFYENLMGVEVQEVDYSIYATMYSGLNIETKGRYSSELSRFRNMMRREYPDAKERNQIYKELVIENLTENPKEVLKLMVSKFDDAWGGAKYSGEHTFITWSMKYNENAIDEVKIRREEEYKILSPVLRVISAAFWIVLLCGGIIGSVSCIWEKCDYTFLISMIYVFGFALMLQIMCVQGRYKIILYLPLIMLSAYGIYRGEATIRKIMCRKGTDDNIFQ